MSVSRQILKALPLGLGLPVLIAAASVSPKDAISNLSKWAAYLGIHNIPPWLSNVATDRWVIYGSLLVAVVYFFAMWGPRFRATVRPGEAHSEPYDQTIRWAMEYIAPNPDEGDAALKALRQAARSGTITIYGRPESGHPADEDDKPFEAIPADYWRDFGFDTIRCIFHENPRECRTEPDDIHSATYGSVYVDLRVNSTQIKAKSQWQLN
jgi:hypothetical protein